MPTPSRNMLFTAPAVWRDQRRPGCSLRMAAGPPPGNSAMDSSCKSGVTRPVEPARSSPAVCCMYIARVAVSRLCAEDRRGDCQAGLRQWPLEQPDCGRWENRAAGRRRESARRYRRTEYLDPTRVTLSSCDRLKATDATGPPRSRASPSGTSPPPRSSSDTTLRRATRLRACGRKSHRPTLARRHRPESHSPW